MTACRIGMYMQILALSSSVTVTESRPAFLILKFLVSDAPEMDLINLIDMVNLT